MRITIKTLQQTQFPLEISPEEKVKEKISELVESKNLSIERQKLIHAGKVLENNQLVSETALKEGDFVVLMAPAAPSVPAGKPLTSSATSNVAPLAMGPTGSSTQAPSELESRLVTGEAYEEAVNRLVDMGFAKDEVTAAMRASFNNPERAVEYLTTGVIPAEEDEDIAAPAVGGEGRPNTGSLDFLRNDPQFQQLRALIQQNPQMLAPIIEQLSQTSPELLQLIEQNREEFYSLIMEGTNMEDLAAVAGEEGSEEEGETYAEGGSGNIPPPGAQILRVSEEERQAIERLEAMGFEKARVVEAFFACDKNEELAVNFLLEHLNDQD